MPRVRLMAWALMCSCLAMMGASGWSAAASTRYGTSAETTIAATTG